MIATRTRSVSQLSVCAIGWISTVLRAPRVSCQSGKYSSANTSVANYLLVALDFLDRSLLSKALDIIFAIHVNEERTIRVEEVWGSRSKNLKNKDNPNLYWNRPDAESLQGK